jgi:hypothetical protein
VRLSPRLAIRDDLRSTFYAFVAEDEAAHLDQGDDIALTLATDRQRMSWRGSVFFASSNWRASSAAVLSASTYRPVVIPPGKPFGIAPTRLPGVSATVVSYGAESVPFAYPTTRSANPHGFVRRMRKSGLGAGGFFIMAIHNAGRK